MTPWPPIAHMLRPAHGWFFLWEEVIPSLYRVIAVVVAAVITAVLLVLVGLPWWAAVPGGGALWIGLAIVQEHDERVPRPVDQAFVHAVRERVEPVLPAAGFTSTSPRVGSGPDATPLTSSSTRQNPLGAQAWARKRIPVSTCGSVEPCRHDGCLRGMA